VTDTTNHAQCHICSSLERLLLVIPNDGIWCCADCCIRVMGNYLDQRKADHGPQKSPSSVRAVEAQVRQTRKELSDGAV